MGLSTLLLVIFSQFGHLSEHNRDGNKGENGVREKGAASDGVKKQRPAARGAGKRAADKNARATERPLRRLGFCLQVVRRRTVPHGNPSLAGPPAPDSGIGGVYRHCCGRICIGRGTENRR